MQEKNVFWGSKDLNYTHPTPEYRPQSVGILANYRLRPEKRSEAARTRA